MVTGCRLQLFQQKKKQEHKSKSVCETERVQIFKKKIWIQHDSRPKGLSLECQVLKAISPSTVDPKAHSSPDSR